MSHLPEVTVTHAPLSLPRLAPRRVLSFFATTTLVAGFLVSGASADARPLPPTQVIGASAAAPPVRPTIPAKVSCGALLQNGMTANSLVPDFTKVHGAPTRIESATVVPATDTAPEYCDVKGYVQSQVKFELKLPTTTWQGRYLQVGCGGFCGQVSATTFPSCRTDLGGDFAIAATDDGHQSAQSTDGLWAGFDQSVRNDFGYRGVHVVALASKAIQKAYYGERPSHSYFQGCSDGGREGLMEAQRYPDDFDGILAGAPANYMSTAALYLASLVSVNTDGAGKPILTADKVGPLSAAVTQACDSGDGINGNGLIGDPRDCEFDPGTLLCRGADTPTCLTSAQIHVVRTWYTGARDRNGKLLDPRLLPRGSESSWVGWVVPAPPRDEPGAQGIYIAKAFGEGAAGGLDFPIGKGKDLADVDLTVSEFREVVKTASIYDPTNPDLSRFRARGGKLMVYQGLSDALVPPFGILDYYDAVRDAAGGQVKTDKFARLFMIPGMNHCGGGPTPDTSSMIHDLVDWVEAGAAPQEVVVSDTYQGQARQRPIYRYPLESHLKPGSPDPDLITSYQPAPPARHRVDTVDWVGSYLVHGGGRRH